MDLRGLIDDLIQCERQEVAEHHVDDRPEPRHRRADGKTGETRLGDRRVDDTMDAELLDETVQHVERRAGFGDVLAEDDDPRIAAHLLDNRLAYCVRERDLTNHRDDVRHRCPPSPCSGPDRARRSQM
jgi:hypothetical protein